MATSGAAVDERYPKISIVTPSLNQGRYLDAAIRSVLEQGYPNLEYIVIDGGSSDDSRRIIERYSGGLAYWQSEPDCGQAHALNKGFRRATGDILAWLNADDTYESGTLTRVVEAFSTYPDADIMSGQCLLWHGTKDDRLIGPSPLRTYADFLRVGSNWTNDRLILQPEAFFRRSVYERAGPLREDLHYCFDTIFWLAAARAGFQFESVADHWANLRLHSEQKTADLQGGLAELAEATWQFLQRDWDSLGGEARLIADDVFGLLLEVRMEERRQRDSLRNSTSYRLGRIITRMKVW